MRAKAKKLRSLNPTLDLHACGFDSRLFIYTYTTCGPLPGLVFSYEAEQSLKTTVQQPKRVEFLIFLLKVRFQILTQASSMPNIFHRYTLFFWQPLGMIMSYDVTGVVQRKRQ